MRSVLVSLISLGVVSLVGIGTAYFKDREIQQLRIQAREVYLEQTNLRAELDSTRLVVDQYRRLAVQREIERDSLAVALDERPVLETIIEIQTESVDTVIVAEERADSLHINYADSLVQIDVSVATVPPHNSSLHYLLAPLRLSLSGRCGMPNPLGQRDALITVDAGRPVNISQARFDPELCNPIADLKTSGISFWDIFIPTGAFGLGLLLNK